MWPAIRELKDIRGLPKALSFFAPPPAGNVALSVSAGLTGWYLWRG